MVGLIDFIFHLFLPRETSEMFRHFLLITKTTQPRPLSFSSFDCLLNNSGNFAAQLRSFFDISQTSSDLSDELYVIIANQKRINILN